MKMNPIVTSIIRTLLVLPIVMCLVSCEDEESTLSVTPEMFHLQRDLFSYSDTDIYEWDTVLAQARVRIHVEDFSHGDASIRVRDSNGREIFYRIFNTLDPVWYVGGEFDFTGTTAVGVPGRWTIELRYDDVTGETDLTLD